ncbi:hypothetical protein BDV3_000267 [Batrachochytrium dendrobatidis]|nr:hypothetical protein QVD99_005001 [Batrachochytrium dendrobatidis]
MSSLQSVRFTCCGCADLRTATAFINCINLFTTLLSLQAMSLLLPFNFFILNNLIVLVSLLGLWAAYTNEARWAIPFSCLFFGITVTRIGFGIKSVIGSFAHKQSSINQCISINPQMLEACENSVTHQLKLTTLFVVLFSLTCVYCIYIEFLYAYMLWKNPVLSGVQSPQLFRQMQPQPAPVYEMDSVFDPVPVYTPPYEVPKANGSTHNNANGQGPLPLSTCADNAADHSAVSDLNASSSLTSSVPIDALKTPSHVVEVNEMSTATQSPPYLHQEPHVIALQQNEPIRAYPLNHTTDSHSGKP